MPAAHGHAQATDAAARAVATETGYHFSGESIIENAEDNPRSAHFVAVARAVINAILPIEREVRRQREYTPEGFRRVQD